MATSIQGVALLIRTSNIVNEKCPKCVLINQNRIRIGRHGDVRMDTNAGKEISKRHAEITRTLKRGVIRFFIEDLDSVNGTFVNCRKILKQQLVSKDDIIFGGGNRYCFGDILPQPEESECMYRFIIPYTPANFSQCLDFDMEITDDGIDECCICYTKRHKMQQLSCGHSFCVACLAHWAKECSKSMRPIVCPVCRCPFTRTEIENDQPIIQNGVEIVRSIEPLLHMLSVKSVKEVQELDISKQWDQQKKEKFWRMNEIVNDFHSFKRSFHTLVNATYYQVLLLNEDQLKTVIVNLDGNLDELTEGLMEEAITRVAVMIMNIKNSKPKVATMMPP